MRAIASIFVGLLIAGCAVDQKKDVSLYRETVDLRPASTQPGQPMTLEQVLLMVNERDEQLSIGGEAYLRSIVQRRRSVANFLPTVDLAPSYIRREKLDSSTGGSAHEVLDVPAELRLNLFNGFQDVNSYWRDTFAIEQEKQNLLDLQQSLLLDAAGVFYQVLRSEASVQVLEQSLATQEERLRDIQGRFDAGMARPLDVAQTEAQVASTRVTLIDARRDVAAARLLLGLLASADFRDQVLHDEYTPDALPALDAALQLAAANRNDLLAANAALKASRRDVEVAVGQYYPSVSLNFEAFLYRESVPDERTWEGLLELNLPLFSAGRIEADVREAWSFHRQAQLVLQRLTRQVRQQIETALLEVNSSVARIGELEVQERAAQQAYDQADQSYRAGLATNLDRVAAQQALLNAQLRLSSERFDRKLRDLELKRQIGVLRKELELELKGQGARGEGQDNTSPLAPRPSPP